MILFITPDTESVSRLARSCELGDDDYHHHVPDGEAATLDVLSFVENNQVEVVSFGPDIPFETAEPLLGDLAEQFPLLVLVVFTDDTAAGIRAALRAGATDIVTRSMEDDEIVEVLSSALSRGRRRKSLVVPTAAAEAATGRVITAVSPRGGVGRTMVSTGLAVLLERRAPGEVVLLDLALQSGDVAPLLGLTSDLSIASIASRGTEFDSADVKTLLSKTDEGLHVLPAPQSLTAAVEVSAATTGAVVETLRASFRYVVIDTSSSFSDESLTAIDASTDLLLVCATDVPSVRALGRTTDALDELRVTGPTRHLVVNRSSDRYGMPLRDIEAVTGLESVATIPAAKEIAMTMNTGSSFDEILQSRGVIAKGLRDLAQSIAPEPDRGSMTRRLLGRS